MNNFCRKLLAPTKTTYTNGIIYRKIEEKSIRFYNGGVSQSPNLLLP